MVSRGCQEFALEAVYIPMVPTHHKNAVQSLLWYSFIHGVVMEEALFYLLLFS